jgi:hypothetical protein
MNQIAALALLVMTVTSCAPARRSAAEDIRISAARLLTMQYERSELAKWQVRAAAAGPDCGVLLVHIPFGVEDAMIRAMHYGAGAYNVYDGGVERFYPQYTFASVVYTDASTRMWVYGDIQERDALKLETCQ